MIRHFKNHWKRRPNRTTCTRHRFSSDASSVFGSKITLILVTTTRRFVKSVKTLRAYQIEHAYATNNLISPNCDDEANPVGSAFQNDESKKKKQSPRRCTCLISHNHTEVYRWAFAEWRNPSNDSSSALEKENHSSLTAISHLSSRVASCCCCCCCCSKAVTNDNASGKIPFSGKANRIHTSCLLRQEVNALTFAPIWLNVPTR